MPTPRTLFDRLGGEPFFDALTEKFYAKVAADDVLVPVYPEDPDRFEGSRQHLRDFLIQFFGGPRTYSETRGSPMLKQRHIDMAIGRDERDAWVRLMVESIDESGVSGLDRAQMVTYFENAATLLINRPA